MFITFKRWILNEGGSEDQVVSLVREAIRPAYSQLPGCLGIGLLRIEGTRAYLATQYWESRAARDAAVSAESYAAWWSAYQPALEQWDALMTFEEEWEAEEILR